MTSHHHLVAHDHICTLLDALLSRDSARRTEGENELTQLQETDPNSLVLSLIRELEENTDYQVRDQVAVLLRSLLLTFKGKSCWERLTSDTITILQQRLLSCVDTENKLKVRRSICAIIIAVATKPEISWPLLQQQLMALAESPKPETQAMTLRILSDLYPQIEIDASKQLGRFQPFILSSAKSNRPEVQIECLGFVTSVVQCEKSSVWKPLQELIPAFMHTIIFLIEKKDFEVATEFLGKLVEIADTKAIFFKPHLHALVQMLLQIAGDGQIEEEARATAMEILVGLPESNVQMCLKVPNFVNDLVALIMKFMLLVKEDESFLSQVEGGQEKSVEETDDDDDDLDDEDNFDDIEPTDLYDVGECGLDRIAAAMGSDAMSVIYRYIAHYLPQPEWQYRVVALMAISQTAEYLEEEDLDSHLDSIVQMLVGSLKDSHPRVRFAACQGIGQIALDVQPRCQKEFAHVVLSGLLEVLDDPLKKVQSHAVAAFVNFAEEVDKADLLPIADTLMTKLLMKTSPQEPRNLQKQAITCIAVVAGVLEEAFLKYYSVVMFFVKGILSDYRNGTKRSLCGRAAECASTVGLSIGADVFSNDVHEIMQLLLEIRDNADKTWGLLLQDYLQESFSRICRCLKERFFVYLPHLVPPILKLLQMKRDLVLNETDSQTNIYADEGLPNLKTADLEEVSEGMEAIGTYVEILGPLFGEYLVPSAEAILPYLHLQFNEDVLKSALKAMTEILKATRASQDPQSAAAAEAWLREILEIVFKYLENPENVYDLEMMTLQLGGMSKCLQAAGSNVLTLDQIRILCDKVFLMLKESELRKNSIAIKKQQCDEDELEDYDTIETTELNFRQTLLEILAALMEFHPHLYLESASAITESFIKVYLEHSRPAQDRTLAFYVVDDLLQYLKDNGASLWPCFAHQLVTALLDEDVSVRQAASFGVVQAAHCSKFPEELIQQAANNLALVLRNPKSKEKSQQLATDNAISALGAIVLHSGKQLKPSAEDLLNLWINMLPLKADEEEGRKVHADFVRLLLEQNASVLGPNRSNLPKLAAICAEIYRTDFSSAEIDQGIRQFAQAAGFDVIKSIGVNFGQRLQKGLERIHRDVVVAKE